ncbi:MAG: hypothetical protein PHQ42_03255 [Patescibacteria group bacterium]|nr:hypothetical protein [Patescibacteria group bacterium]
MGLINREIETKKGILIIIAAFLIILGGILFTNIDLLLGAPSGDADTLSGWCWDCLEYTYPDPGDPFYGDIKEYVDSKSVPCTPNNSGECYISQVYKSDLDTDLTAGNIKTGINIFGVDGSYSGPVYSDCLADNSGNCYISQATKSALDADLASGNIKSGVNIFGVAGSYVGKNKVRCRGKQGSNYTTWCTLGTDCYDQVVPTYGYNGYLYIQTLSSDSRYVRCWNTYNEGADLSCQCEAFE